MLSTDTPRGPTCQCRAGLWGHSSDQNCHESLLLCNLAFRVHRPNSTQPSPKSNPEPSQTLQVELQAWATVLGLGILEPGSLLSLGYVLPEGVVGSRMLWKQCSSNGLVLNKEDQ